MSGPFRELHSRMLMRIEERNVWLLLTDTLSRMGVIHLQFCKMRDAGVAPGDTSHLVASDVCHTRSSLL